MNFVCNLSIRSKAGVKGLRTSFKEGVPPSPIQYQLAITNLQQWLSQLRMNFRLLSLPKEGCLAAERSETTGLWPLTLIQRLPSLPEEGCLAAEGSETTVAWPLFCFPFIPFSYAFLLILFSLSSTFGPPTCQAFSPVFFIEPGLPFSFGICLTRVSIWFWYMFDSFDIHSVCLQPSDRQHVRWVFHTLTFSGSLISIGIDLLIHGCHLSDISSTKVAICHGILLDPHRLCINIWQLC